ncbi:putative ribonuclease H [Helianthus annuus]|nr:putative ribonuclease H [Helianthus annuus]KAJ0631827.1 putative ribonuclease H [Helianthus annuus]KAJ0635730.1 putative ribonuclease H [Helianthus annuus]KAJ0812506.1 putative ribonuclease H [Helianthus annuus]KAJ0825589.1 putative ribonuclease H [Helianthus annuus]
MTSLFKTCSSAIFARTTGNLVARCLSSGVTRLSFRRRIDHHVAFVTAENGFLLTRFRACCYSTRKATCAGKSKTKKSDPKSEKMLGDEKNAFFVVRKGDLVGVYKNLNECQAQVGSSVCDPPVSVYKGYTMPKEAEEYMISCGLKNALYSIKAADLTEELFGNLVACPYQPPRFALGEPSSDHLSKRKFPEVLGSQTGEAFGLRSISSDPARKLAKLEQLTSQAVTNTRTCILEFDGASKGNPGQAGAGAVLRTDDGNLICRLREGLGIATNNVAEYRAVILGLRYALSKGFTSIRVLGDSKLVCMQVQGLWKVKNQNISKLYEEAKKLKDKFLCFQIDHVLRDLNSDADTQANLAVDLAVGQIQEVDS